jgi:hypothetical protein
MATFDADPRRREEATLTALAARLRAREAQLAAREAELSARRSRWSAACRVAFAPLRAVQLVAGVWLAIGAVALGGTVLVVSAVVCGLLLALPALRALQLPSGVQPPRHGRLGRLRCRLARLGEPPDRVEP